MSNLTHILVTPPAGEPVTVNELRTHCRIDGNTEDELLYTLGRSAREYVEAYTGRALVSQTWELRFDQFPLYINLPKAPLASITSITYIDLEGNTQTLASSAYQLVASSGDFSQPGRVFQAYNQTWPSSRGHYDDVRVRYVAGYGTPNDVPYALKAAIKLMTAHLYENREATVVGTIAAEMPLSVRNILAPFVVF